MSDDISLLFATDALSLTNEDITKIIEHMRAKRGIFLAGPEAAKTPKPTKSKPIPVQLDLSDLNIKL